MALRTIRMLGDPVLREEAPAVEAFGPDLVSLVEDMFETMYHAEGVGLAAPQIGVSTRVLVVDVRGSEEEPGGRLAFINPRVVKESREVEKSAEGCLSIPGIEDVVERSYAVVVEGQNALGEPQRVEANGLLARALLHEIDHLDGILFIDRVTPFKRRILLKKWKKLQEEEQA